MTKKEGISLLLLILLVLLLAGFSESSRKRRGASRETAEKRLLADLFRNYDSEVRPVFNDSDKVNVEFSLSLIQIIAVNSKSQLVTVSVWIRQKWTNPMLAWNTSKYGGIESVNLNPAKVWIPDIILYNNADETYAGGLEKYKTSVIASSDGTQEWNSPASFTSTCNINVRYFPFDSQNCSLKFGSWTYVGNRLTMTSTSDSADLSKYVNNGEWHLLAMPAKLNRVFYNCCKYPFYDVTLYLEIQRKPLYYVFNLIIPCALIATLTLIKFFLPPESGEKVGLGITVLLAMTVFLLLVAETLPSTSDHIPLLGQYFVATMFVTAISLVATCLILNFFHRNPSTSPMPHWVKVIILDYMARSPRNARLMRDDSVIPPSGRSTPCERRRMSTVSSQLNPFTERLLDDINVLAEDVRARQEDERLREEWRCAALVLDRMFFWIMLVTSLMTSFMIFYRDPVMGGEIK
ncbi:predicted protein [Nematostella vectensis]|uniref:Uncharacterized protein n=1 Tax=Nematostella vectensis TaxID=45351 RepID=A7S2J7_NEMVE|nr:predicted protein [Nematostella vectensis]|eukprot:XP_001634117.1 predicted protein [Nematostella vectensis]